VAADNSTVRLDLDNELGRISRLDLLPALAEQVVVPQAVLQELRAGANLAPERAVGTRQWEGFLADHLSQPA